MVRLLLSYMILLAMEELHMLGQHWQMAQAADPKQLKEKLKYWLQYTIRKHERMSSAGYDSKDIILKPSHKSD